MHLDPMLAGFESSGPDGKDGYPSTAGDGYISVTSIIYGFWLVPDIHREPMLAGFESSGPDGKDGYPSTTGNGYISVTSIIYGFTSCRYIAVIGVKHRQIITFVRSSQN